MTLIAAAERYDVATSVELDASGNPVLASEDEEQIACVCEPVALHLGELTAGAGKLFITTRRVIWKGADSATNLALNYPQIVMHAVSKDTSAFPRPCIYLQLDDGSEDDMMGPQEGEEEEVEDEPAGASPEVRLVPNDASKVEELFKALCDCAALNPDPENEDEGEFFFNEGEVMAGLDDATRAALVAQRMEGGAMALEDGEEELDQLVGEDPDRFMDDEEGEEEADETGATTGAATNGH